MKHLITGLIAVAFLSAGCGGDEKKLASETSKKAETVEQKAEIPSNEPKQEVAALTMAHSNDTYQLLVSLCRQFPCGLSKHVKQLMCAGRPALELNNARRGIQREGESAVGLTCLAGHEVY